MKIIRRMAAIGDCLACTIVADKLIELGFEVGFEAHSSIHGVLRRHPGLAQVQSTGGRFHVNLDGAYEKNPLRRQRHFYGMFMDSARAQLRPQGVELGTAINCRPKLRRNPIGTAAFQKQFADRPKPWVFICPRSESYKVRQVPDGIWQQVAKQIQGTCFWLGLFPGPEGIVDLHCRHLPLLMDYLGAADLLVTVDTGPMHIANALGIPIVAIGQSSSPELHLSDQTDFATIEPPGLACLNCQENVCPKNQWRPPCQEVPAELIASAVNRALRATQSEDISAIIPIYKPRAEMLNRCLEAVLPQVDEVVITMEKGGIVPQDTINRFNIHELTSLQVWQTPPIWESKKLHGLPLQGHAAVEKASGYGQNIGAMQRMPQETGKVFAVRKPADNIGFGRNVNFGVRHSAGKYLLILNDDVYLAPDAVRKMRDVMGPEVGLVGQLTRYPDGKIYHAGKVRPTNGGIGFPHIDLGRFNPTITQPVEMENTNGASILVRRKAFYEAGGYDEGFQFYCEDDHLCMTIRLHGWQVWFTPLATGIHDSHQESAAHPSIRNWMGQSNSRFGKIWGGYFRHNAGNGKLGNFAYLTEREKYCLGVFK